MKSRSSTGVGMKIDLDYNIDTMRMTDLADDVTDNRPQGNIMDQIKSNPVSGNTDESKVTATVQSSKLKNMLAGLKQND
jgi:hypothetical protein